MSPRSDSASADLQQIIADLRRANVELQRTLNERTAERDEAFSQQTATAEVLQVINSSPGDLQLVFDAMLERAIGLCDAVQGVLWTIDNGRGRPAASRGVPPEFVERLRESGEDGSNSLLQRTMRGEQLIHFVDTMEQEVYRSGDPVATAAVRAAGVRSLVWVALVKDDLPVGAIAVARREARPFSDKQIALLQNFAAQAVIAMENARLVTETREALEQQTATAEVLQVINSSPGDLAPIFDAILEKAHILCGSAHGSLFLRDGDHFQPAATRGVPEALAARLRQGGLGLDAPPSGPLLRGEPFVHITDLTGFDHPLARAALAGGVRTVLSVPLSQSGALIGLIVAARLEESPFTDKQIALLQNFAQQAVIAMENARLIAETREALEQQTATAEVLGVINSSPGDLAPVFDAMLDKAMRLCDAALGHLYTADGEGFRPGAARGDPRFGEWLFQRGSFLVVPGSPLDRIKRGERFVQIEDATKEEAYRPGSGFRDLIEASNTRTQLAVALRKDDAVLGAIVIYRREVRPFSDKQIALLQNFAAQAVIAMENARLLTETREALEQQTATAEVLQVINSSPGDLAPVFDAILDKAHALCGAALGSLVLIDGEKAQAVATRGYPQAYDALARGGWPISQFSDRLREPFLQVADLAEIPNPSPIVGAAVEIAEIRTMLLVPLRKEGVLLGYMTAQRQEVRPFTDKQIALLQNFAAQAVIAMENARLLGELRQRTEEVAELNRGLEARVAEQVDELGRVGRLKRFLAPQLAELIVSQGDEKILESHRREIVVVFCDLRGYTAFTETAEPEEVLDFLREYHGALGPLVAQFEGTLDQFSGDGIMVFFNDPVPIPDPAERAVRMAVAMREAAASLIAVWRERGRDLGFGAGIAQGYATLGQIGFSERSGYTAIGTVCNVAARLCAEAKDGQILLSQRVNVALRGSVATEQIGPLALRGLTQPVVAYNVPLATSQPALRVIEGGPQSV